MLFGFTGISHAAPHIGDSGFQQLSFQVEIYGSLPDRLVQADENEGETSKSDEDETNKSIEPKSGTLLLPSSTKNINTKDTKKCMTVCSRFGQDCIIDPNRGRQCRRTCKEFAKECF